MQKSTPAGVDFLLLRFRFLGRCAMIAATVRYIISGGHCETA